MVAALQSLMGQKLVEVSPRSVVSLSPFNGHEAEFNTTINYLTVPFQVQQKAFQLAGENACVILPSSHRQWFLCFEDEVPDPVATASDLFGKMTLNQVAMTDQSDAWVILALTGPLIYSHLRADLPN